MRSQDKRQALKEVYPNRKWLLKVNKMTDEQVNAILKRLKEQGVVKT